MSVIVKLTRLHGPLANYGIVIHDEASGMTACVDAGDADPILDVLDAEGWALDQCWVTHFHPDHTAGIEALKATTGCHVYGPVGSTVPIRGLDTHVGAGDRITFGAHHVDVIATPGHTLDMINFHMADEGHVFCGDTLFVMGCGRLFEGTPAQMHQSLTRLAALPDETVVWCAHEYSLANAEFAAVCFPDNREIAARRDVIRQQREDGVPTIPSTIGMERRTNPFLLARDADDFARLRALKDKS